MLHGAACPRSIIFMRSDPLNAQTSKPEKRKNRYFYALERVELEVEYTNMSSGRCR